MGCVSSAAGVEGHCHEADAGEAVAFHRGVHRVELVRHSPHVQRLDRTAALDELSSVLAAIPADQRSMALTDDAAHHVAEDPHQPWSGRLALLTPDPHVLQDRVAGSTSGRALVPYLVGRDAAEW